MPFFFAPNLRGGFQDFHQRAAQLCYRQPIPVGMCLHTTRSSQGSKLLGLSHFRTKHDWATPCPVKQLQGEVLPIWQPMPRPPTASDTLPPQNNNHPTTLHHVTNMQIRSQKQLMSKHIFGWTQPPWRVPSLSSTSCAALLQAANSRSRRTLSSHHRQQPELEADALTFPTKNDWATPCPVKQLQGEVLPIWQPMLRPPTASDTPPPQNNHHPTNLSRCSCISMKT